MTLSVKYNAEFGFVESTLCGIVSPEELRQETIQSVAMGEAHDCNFFLSDFSEADVYLTDFDIYDLPVLQDETGLDRCAQIAVIAPKSDRGHELAELYETVSFNRSWSAQVFRDRQAAIDWLVGS